MVSEAFAELYGMRVGKRIGVLASDSVYERPASLETVKLVEIIGIFANTESAYDSFILGSLKTGKYIKGENFDNKVSVFYIEVEDVDQIEETRDEVLSILDEVEVLIVPRKMSVSNIFEEKITTILFIIALFNAAFSSFRNLSASVSEQEKEIGMLKAIGVPRKSIIKLFLYEGLLISSFGCLIGIITSGILLGQVNRVYSSLLGYPSDFIVLSPTVAFYALLFPFVASFLISLYPAYKVTRTKTIKMLRI